MNKFLHVFLICVIVLLAGCKRGPNVEGEWAMESGGAASTAVLDLHKGGTFTMMGREGFWKQSGDTVELEPKKTMGVSDAEQHGTSAIEFKIEKEGKLLVQQGGDGLRLVPVAR
jgi:hypothetical protein